LNRKRHASNEFFRSFRKAAGAPFTSLRKAEIYNVLTEFHVPTSLTEQFQKRKEKRKGIDRRINDFSSSFFSWD
jgi:hypothetical protein